jgi:hypothetical protein
MTTITWIIEWMTASTTEINGHSEVVLNAGWRCNGADGTYNATVYGSVGFPQPETGGSFTPYADLTQDQVLGWCWSNGVNKDSTESEIQGLIQTQINPPVVQPPLPWSA